MPTRHPPSDSSGEPSDNNQGRPRAWAIGSERDGCAHPCAELDYLGDDGVNGYYRCRRCAAAVVIEAEILGTATDRG